MAGRLGFTGFRAMQGLMARLPRPWAYALAIVVSRVALVTAGTARRRLESNLRQAVPEAGGARIRELARLNFRYHAKAYADLMWMPRASVDQLRPLLTLEGLENLESARSIGRGVMVVSAHMGSWEIAAAIWSSSFAPVSLFAEVLEPRGLYDWYRRTRARLGITVLPLSRAGLHQVVDALGRQEMVVTAIDRDIVGTGIEVPFFGRTARIPGGPAAIALRLGTPILPVCVYRLEDDTYHGVGLQPVLAISTGDRAEDIRRVTGLCLRQLEDCIRARPEQWHMPHAVWPEESG
ncbi:MAG: lysophospholipid acyltransferase family protein [Candidatus Dormibacteraceae bacterium]